MYLHVITLGVGLIKNSSCVGLIKNSNLKHVVLVSMSISLSVFFKQDFTKVALIIMSSDENKVQNLEKEYQGKTGFCDVLLTISLICSHFLAHPIFPWQLQAKKQTGVPEELSKLLFCLV